MVGKIQKSSFQRFFKITIPMFLEEVIPISVTVRAAGNPQARCPIFSHFCKGILVLSPYFCPKTPPHYIYPLFSQFSRIPNFSSLSLPIQP